MLNEKFLLTETNENKNKITTIEILNNKKLKFFLTSKKGKLFTHPNFTAFNKKTNKNSIPSKIEKHLIKASSLENIFLNKNLNKLFSNHIKILSKQKINKNNIKKNKQNFLISTNIKNNNFLLKNNFNKKGYLNGFLSQSLRFLPNEKKIPGPGEYNFKTYEIKTKVNKSLFGKSFFIPKKNFSLIEKKPFPSVGDYTINFNNNSNDFNSFFKFQGDRFKNGFFESVFKNKNPGPGKYFNNKNINNVNVNNDYLKTNYFFKEKKNKKDSDENRLKINDGDKKIFKYKLTDKHNQGEVKNYWKGIPKLNNNENNNNNNNNFNFNNENNKNNENNIKKHYFCGYRIDGEDLIGCINNNSDDKPQIFELNSPRWKNDNYSFKVPGPAYYHPKLPKTKVSFNISNKKFIYTNSFPYLQTNEENYLII